ncbi:MAG: hypothetical protein AB7R40_26480 [Nitrospiraceae bacterium]
MAKHLVIVNIILTVPFGVAALASPQPLFAQFGVGLSDAGVLVARGYAATLIGYGVLLWGVRDAEGKGVLKFLLLSVALFNGIEAVIQAVAAFAGIAAGAIYVNVVIHALVTAWAFFLFTQGARAKA